MRDVREINRRKLSASVATREIARRLSTAPSPVRETLKRPAEKSPLTMPPPLNQCNVPLQLTNHHPLLMTLRFQLRPSGSEAAWLFAYGDRQLVALQLENPQLLMSLEQFHSKLRQLT